MYFLDITSFRLWYANPLTGFWRKNDIEFMIFSWNVCNVIFKCTWEKKKKDLQVDPLSISFLICWNVFSWKRKTKRWGLYESRRRACNCLTARRRRFGNKRSSPARDRFRERIPFSSVIRLEESRAKSYFFKYTNQFFDYFCNVLKVSYYFQLAKRSIKLLSKCNDKLFEGCFHILNILNN